MRLSIFLSAALAACVFSAASAETRVDRTFRANGGHCRDVEWSTELLRAYPGIGAACQSVETRDGKTFVKFEGVVKDVLNDGQQVKIDFREGETLTLAPPPHAVLYMDGRATPVSRLKRGMKLNFYVPEDQLTAQFFAAEGSAESVAVPIVAEQASDSAPIVTEQAAVNTQSPAPTVEPQRVAARELPATGSTLPLIGWSATLLVLFAAGATWLRRSGR